MGQSGSPIAFSCPDKPCVLGVLSGSSGQGNLVVRLTQDRINLFMSDAVCAFQSLLLDDPRCDQGD
jgi:hypothetical protein